ncbi:MAG: type II toxin-antitoxin system RelE/ParE family toxin, partial [Candidatus Bipolaricaulia bacterium]
KDFHELKGDRAGTYAMRVSKNYRITFRWDGQNAYDVDFENYH